MKKIIFFYFVVVSVYSQTPLHDKLKSCKEISEVDISKYKRTTFFLGKDNLDVFSSDKLIELYKDLNIKPEICLVPISVSNEFNVYVEIPVTIFEEKKDIVTYNVFGSYLIFDRIANILYRIDSESACGTTYKKNKKVLVIDSYFGALKNDVIILDKNLNIVGIYNENVLSKE